MAGKKRSGTGKTLSDAEMKNVTGGSKGRKSIPVKSSQRGTGILPDTELKRVAGGAGGDPRSHEAIQPGGFEQRKPGSVTRYGAQKK